MSDNKLIPQEERAMDEAGALGQIVEQMMRPVLETLAKFMQNNTEAMERLAQTQQVQADRLKAMEIQLRLQTPMTKQQVKYINDAIRAHGRALLDRRGVEDAAALRKLANCIRKSLLARYGVGAVNEIPRHEYSVAMQQIEIWNDVIAVRDVIREAKKRNEKMENTQRPENGDGAAAHAAVDGAACEQNVCNGRREDA